MLGKLEPHLNAGKPAITLELTPEEKAIARGFYLLTDKPTIFAANVKEGDLATADSNPLRQARCANMPGRTSPARRWSSARKLKAT